MILSVCIRDENRSDQSDNSFFISNSFFLIEFGVDRISRGFRYKYGFFRCRKWYGFGPVSERKQIFLKSDNMCLCVIFYDEKQFINQSHKTVVQYKIITINPPLRFKLSKF
jgi:hypothetical protein